jgi:acetyl esterase
LSYRRSGRNVGLGKHAVMDIVKHAPASVLVNRVLRMPSTGPLTHRQEETIMPAKVIVPLDPNIAEMERRWQESGIPGIYVGRNGAVSRERARNVRALLYPKPKLPAGRLERFTIPGPNGPIMVETVQPVQGPPLGTLVYYHGGGYVIGDIDSHQAHAIRFANRSRVVVLNVDYRLAPEHPFPQGVNDAFAAARWASANLGKLGGADKPLAIGGDSSGGNFTAVTAIRARDAGMKIAAQVLIYGALGAEVGGGGGNADIAYMYFGPDLGAEARKTTEASPILADLKGVAPAIIGVGSHDFLYEDSVAYTAKLREAGVPVIYREYPNLNHGFFSYTAISPACAAASDQLCDDLRSLLS